MKVKKSGKNKREVKFVILGIMIIILVLFFLGTLLTIPKKIGEEPQETQSSVKKIENAFFSANDATKVLMYLPAVDVEGKGVTTILKVEAAKGSGRTLTDIDNLLFWADTQHSIRIARRVAENITWKRMEDYDIVYSIEANATLIGGPSAGAALAIATIAALEGKKLNDNAMITGSINHDGSIGPVSSILEKAKAAKESGVNLFLVPLLQSKDVVYEETEHCEIFGYSEICSTETRPKRVDVEVEAGIEVVEVENVQQAMEYFFN